jgi:hypothetical protein
MKTLIIVSIILIQATFSQQNPSKLNGNWTLICLNDIKNEKRDWRPEEYSVDQLTFDFMDDGDRGTIKGKTTVNDVIGSYVLDRKNIQVLSFGGTKIAEQGWGSDLWSTIKKSDSYAFQEDTLFIYFDEQTKAMMFLPFEE